jgi:hypothetical protein
MQEIQIIGVKDLDDMEMEAIHRLANRYYGKIQRELQNTTSLKVHIKSYDKQGRQKKYSVHVQVIAPTHTFVSTKAVDWNLEKALHKSFEDVRKIIQHRLHTDDQRRKPYS